MIGRTCILLLLSLLIIALSNPPRELQAKSITITASRSSQLANLCANTNRASLYTQYGSSTTIQYSADFARYFTLDKYHPTHSGQFSANF